MARGQVHIIGLNEVSYEPLLRKYVSNLHTQQSQRGPRKSQHNKAAREGGSFGVGHRGIIGNSPSVT